MAILNQQERKETMELFHKLWGQAHDGEYNKSDWKRLQMYLEKLLDLAEKTEKT